MAIGLLFALAYVTAHVWFPKPPGRVIDGDALGYYAWLRSVVFDGDINFSNDYRLLTDELAEDSGSLTPLETGLVPNKSPPGSALLWAPLFLVVAAIVWTLNLVGAQIPFDGLALPFKLSAGVAGIAYATAGAWLCYDLARRIYSAAAAFWATLTLWLGGSLLYYSLVSPTYSHAMSLFVVALFTHAWYRTRVRDDLPRFALLGALAGLAGLVRSQDLIILVIPGLELLAGIWERRWSLAAACGRLAVLCVSCAAVFSPQLWAWQTIYGTAVLNPHGAVSFRWAEPAILQTLFSTRQGLISWTPIVLFGAIGLPWLFRRDRLLAWTAPSSRCCSRSTSTPQSSGGGPVRGSADAGSSAICRSSCSGCRPSWHPVRWRPVRHSCASPPSSSSVVTCSSCCSTSSSCADSRTSSRSTPTVHGPSASSGSWCRSGSWLRGCVADATFRHHVRAEPLPSKRCSERVTLWLS